MTKPPFPLLLLFVLFTLTLPTQAIMLFRPGKQTKEDPSTNSQIPLKRQTSRHEILTRSRVKAARAQVDEAGKRWRGPGLQAPPGAAPGVVGSRTRKEGRGVIAARASVVPRWEKRDCVAGSVSGLSGGGGEKLGVARYVGWELEYDDIPNQAMQVGSEADCIDACALYGSGCAGSQYLPENDGSNCYLKSPALTTGNFTNESDEAKSAGAVLSLVGSCDIWTVNVPPTMDAICCDA